MTSDRSSARTHEAIVRKYFKGNPVLDDEAYQKALARCPDEESREFLRILRETALEADDGFDPDSGPDNSKAKS